MAQATQEENGGENVRVAFSLPKELDRAIEIEAAQRDITKSQLVVDAIREYLK